MKLVISHIRRVALVIPFGNVSNNSIQCVSVEIHRNIESETVQGETQLICPRIYLPKRAYIVCIFQNENLIFITPAWGKRLFDTLRIQIYFLHTYFSSIKFRYARADIRYIRINRGSREERDRNLYSHKSIEPKVADFSLRQSRSTPVSILSAKMPAR